MFSFTFSSPFKLQGPKNDDMELREIEEGAAKDVGQSVDLDMPASLDTSTQDSVGLPLFHSGNGRWNTMDGDPHQQEDHMDEDSRLRKLEEGGTKDIGQSSDPNMPTSFTFDTPILPLYQPEGARHIDAEDQRLIRKLPHHASGSSSVIEKPPIDTSKGRKDERDHSGATKVRMVESSSRLPSSVSIFYIFRC